MTIEYLQSAARKNIERIAEASFCSLRPGTIDEVRFTMLVENTVRECCKMINAHMQGNNPYDSLLVLQIKEHFGIEPNEGLDIPSCNQPGQ